MAIHIIYLYITQHYHTTSPHIQREMFSFHSNNEYKLTSKCSIANKNHTKSEKHKNMYTLLELHSFITTSLSLLHLCNPPKIFPPPYLTKHGITQRQIPGITNNNAKHNVKLLSLLVVCNLSLKCDNPLPLLWDKHLTRLTYLIIT